MTNPELITAAGQALYGEQWQVPLARDLQMNERTMRRIAQAGREGDDYPLARGVLEDLALLVDKRATTLQHVAGAISDALSD